jgi:UDP-GlcNAc:undecaprenyl-phosphate GlcNAc-1-phosphate transferase
MIAISSMTYVFLATLSGLALTMLTGWIAIRIAKEIKLVDFPGMLPHKQHRNPIPYAGGIALALSFTVLVIGTGLWKVVELRGLFAALFVALVFGIWDDYKKLPAWLKFLGQLLEALILILSGVRIRVLEGEQFFIGGSQGIFFWLDVLLTLLWLVGVTNAFNLVDSADGLAVGLSAWAFVFFVLATLDSQQRMLSLLSAIVLGICIALIFYNSTPARLFLGDAGAQGLGLILSTIAILYTPSAAFQTSSWFVPILLVAVPIFDTTLVTFSRFRRRKPFYLAGMDHTYHRLISLGLEPNRAVSVMHLTALTLECAAFVAVALPPLQANILFGVCILCGVVCMLILDHPRQKS